MLQFSGTPYFDDFAEVKEFYKILFRPGYAVQARELNQLQTILENQIQRFGRHVFVEGSMVIPGQITVDQDFKYIKINPTYNGSAVQWDLLEEGTKIKGATSGIVAKIVFVNQASNAIYVKYSQSGTDDSKVIADNEVINLNATNTAVAQAISSEATGSTAAASIQDGVYFIFGRFLKVESQTILLADFDTKPSVKVGLFVNESIVTPEDDATLLDNANGSSNFAAPGAHRLKVMLQLVKKAISDTTDENFIELLRVNAGVIENLVTNSFYSELEKTLARRTRETNGDYVVRPFKFDLHEHLLSGSNGGIYTAGHRRSYRNGICRRLICITWGPDIPGPCEVATWTIKSSLRR
jgi:hypothetical protein